MDVPRRLDTPAGHADIQQNNVGHCLVRDSQRILVAFALIDDLETIDRLHAELKKINEELWKIEDAIRDKQRVREFDERFIELARAVYFTNDRRSEVKKALNLHLGSEIIEEKSYQDYS